MNRPRKESTGSKPPGVRCAIYTRKSTEEGLDQEFNSLDAQRESAEAYIASQKAQGWVALPERYDDGGYSGGTMDRPALNRLLRDIDAEKIDCVVVYKVDRLSRSLFDFGRIVEVFEKRRVSFVSITQHFDTSHSMGRLMLNVLLSFAQFEREIIGERIRDKIAAQRRKGKWAGGVPVLGYDVDRSGPSPHLVVTPEEAARVRQIFDLYLERGSLLPTVEELCRRGWTNKMRMTTSGKTVGGRAFDKPALYALLTNPIYIGKIVHKKDIYDGEHQAIIPPEVFKRVGELLLRNRCAGIPGTPGAGPGAGVRNKHGALLRGLLRCRACDRTMVHTFAGKTGKKGQKYRYYTCTHALKSGSSTCLSGSLPAAEIERMVVDQIRGIADDPEVVADVIAQARAKVDRELTALQTERDDTAKQVGREHGELRKLATGPTSDSGAAARIADLHERLRHGEQRITEVDNQIETLRRERIESNDVSRALADFEGVWGQLSPREQVKLLALLIASVEYDARSSSVTLNFHAAGIKTLSDNPMEEAA